MNTSKEKVLSQLQSAQDKLYDSNQYLLAIPISLSNAPHLRQLANMLQDVEKVVELAIEDDWWT